MDGLLTLPGLPLRLHSAAFSVTCATIVQCAVIVEASPSTWASSDTAVVVVVVSSHSTCGTKSSQPAF